jgi:hypothetical protein
LNKLHDGAVIIRNLRIAKAGVFFPMPDTKLLDKSLGSRHRAALGITEETDAVVVVVSEERGSISFCFNGNIVSNLDGASLRQALLGLFGQRVRKRGKATLKRGATVTQMTTGSFRVAPVPTSRADDAAPASGSTTGAGQGAAGALEISPPSSGVRGDGSPRADAVKIVTRPMAPAKPIETPKPAPVPTTPSSNRGDD